MSVCGSVIQSKSQFSFVWKPGVSAQVAVVFKQCRWTCWETGMRSLDGGPPAAAIFWVYELSTALAECMSAPQRAATCHGYATPLAMLLNCAYRNQLKATSQCVYCILHLFSPRLNGKLVFPSSEVHLTPPNQNTHSWNSIHLYW